jgi:hypothetical protein
MSMIDDMWLLLPAVYRRLDEENGHVLRALVTVLGEQADVIQDDIARMYDNWFIETCDDWVAPYIGELVGARLPSEGGGDASPAERAALAAVAPSRMLVANTIRWRRRKGAASLLGQIAWDVARWPATTVEFGTRLAVTQDLRFPRRGGGVAGLRDPRPLLRIGEPDDPLSRSIDVREADAPRSPGRFGAANVGVFVFRREIVAVTGVDAAAVDDEGSGQFTFDPLGRDVALHRPALSADDPAATRALPGPITRAALAIRKPTREREGSGWSVDPALYGEGAALMIWTRQREGEPFKPVDPDRIVPADLARWRERPTGARVAVDPELGRIAFSDRAAPDRVRVSYAYAVTGPRGAVAAAPGPDDFAFDKTYIVVATGETHHKSLHGALEQWRKDGGRSALIEIRDSATYDEARLLLDLSKTERRLVIRAANGCRPIIRLDDAQAEALDAWRVRGGREGVAGSAGSRLVLEGLTIGNRGLLFEAYAGALTIRQCTLIPGWSRQGHGRDREAASLMFENCTGSVTIDRSVLGPIHVRAHEEITAPLPVAIADSILDAGEGREIFISPDGTPYLDLTIYRSTVLGALTCHGLTWAENSLFCGHVEIARRQSGFIRFCYVPPGSRTPRRFSCAPRAGADDKPPVFVSRTWGVAGYAEPAAESGADILKGSDDREALGAYHDLYWTARETNLRATLADYLPAGVNAGVIHVD